MTHNELIITDNITSYTWPLVPIRTVRKLFSKTDIIFPVFFTKKEVIKIEINNREDQENSFDYAKKKFR